MPITLKYKALYQELINGLKINSYNQQKSTVYVVDKKLG